MLEISTDALRQDAGADSVRQYFIDIRNTPILKPEEELLLARLMRTGDACARVKFIQHNLRLVVSIARKYVFRCQAMSFPDLIQEGNFGLFKAVDRFDPERGCKFSTYATWWITQAIKDAIKNTDRTIYLPDGIIELKSKLFRQEAVFLEKNGRKPTDREMSALLGITLDRLKQVRFAEDANASLDASFSQDEEGSFYDLTPDACVVDPEVSLDQSRLRESMQKLLSTVLIPEEKKLIEMLFGLDEFGEPMSMIEAAEELGMSRERTKTMYKNAMRKLSYSIPDVMREEL